ncbi:dTDP-4-amino-4,6-dideoxygalactose transaminase [Algoriphagus sediminis]|uniref:dTDP-4-amino-4,6-dideoxygalactose transaminase n=1 Tax=Algoriphagus sediminis TaxID=3057113 RepID=A0ABT7YDU7_9BACT|nr:dTDP-4-amino-4,6-dideoxygalactose transaminase [Algoriphagus sediminis]MDN3204710.1 dTDP-4-amino-4,6-dideoxygalactose transaminase [Algoriphagus sediminis]
MKIPFNKPYQSPKALEYIKDAMDRGHISGNGHYGQKCQKFFEERYQVDKCLLTSSCTDALEMAAILLEIQPGEEVIMPSFTFVSTANAFVLRGAKIRFVDSRADHPGMDESQIEALINEKTKAIVAVHYAGVPCDMDLIMALAAKYNLFIVEDAAQAIESEFKGKQLGSIAHLGCISFHETKNIQCGEGGMLMINDQRFLDRAEVIWNKGTDKAKFLQGEVSKYQWKDLGSSFQLSEVNAAILWSQLEEMEEIGKKRKGIWDQYFDIFCRRDLKESHSYFELVRNSMDSNSNFRIQPLEFRGNSHMFYLVFESEKERKAYSEALSEQGIMAVFHYQSLHKSDFSKQQFPEEFKRELPNADKYSRGLLRLPFFLELDKVNKEWGKNDL